MRTTFDLWSSRTRYSRLSRTILWSALLLILGSLLLIALDNRGFLRPVKSQAQVILRPVERAMTQTRLAVGDSIETVRGTSALQRRVAALEQEVSDLRQANLRLQGLQAENDRLKVELGVRQTYEWMTVGAVVVQANAENGRRMIRIDRGRVDGLQLGMPVVAKEGGSPAALIGLVDALYAQTADVLLITDYGSSISVHTAQATPAKGLIIGQYQVGSRIKLVDVDPAA